MAQRLVRKLCAHCKEPYHPSRDDLPPDFPWEELTEPIYRPKGCRECRHSGYTGRLGLYELLLTTERIRELAHDRASTWEIKKAGMEEGMRTLREDGWRKVLRGVTSVDEVLRITKGDRMISRKSLKRASA